MALYIVLKYFQSYEYNFKEIVWLGIGFAITALLRVNMVVIWIVAVPLVLIRMILKRQWEKIRNCAAGFMLGIMVIFLPVGIYLIYTNCIKEFIDCYIIFNFGYSQGGEDWSGILEAIELCIKNLPFALLALMVSFWPNIKNRLYKLNGLILLVSLYFSHMSGRYYQHYGMILLPMLVILFVGAFQNLYDIISIKDRVKLKLRFPINQIMIVAFVAAALAGVALQYKWANLIREPMMNEGGVKELVDYISSHSAPEDDVLVIGNDAKYYLLADRYTRNKYFYQTPPIKLSDEIYTDFIKEIEQSPADLVVVMGEKKECLLRDDNLGNVYKYFENKAIAGEYQCYTFDNYYIYEK